MVVIWAWPMRSMTDFRSDPPARSQEAWACRRSWTRTRTSTPEFLTAGRQTRVRKVLREIQAVPVQRMDLAYLDEAKIDWSRYSWSTPEVMVLPGRSSYVPAVAQLDDGVALLDRGAPTARLRGWDSRH